MPTEDLLAALLRVARPARVRSRVLARPVNGCHSRSSGENQAMLTEEKLKEWMREHLTYELLMVRHTHAQLHRGLDQMAWNANFGAFGLYARNLHWFLTNNKGRPDLPRKLRACDYASHFKVDDAEITAVMNDLHEQVYHPGARRLDIAKGNGRDKADKVFRWVEEGMAKFVAEIQKIPACLPGTQIGRTRQRLRRRQPGSGPTASFLL